MQAIVLAGNEASQELQELGVRHVFLLQREGQTLLERMCRSLIDGGGCSTVLVRAPGSIELPRLPQVRRLEPRGHVIDDVLAACASELDSPLVLAGAADVPLITPEAVSALRDYSETMGADFTYPVVSREELERQYPGSKRTWLPFAGTRYTGGNVMAFNRSWLLDKAPLLRFFFENRKRPLALVRRIGLGFVLRLALGLATLDNAEAAVGRLAGGRVLAARLPFPELALDLDKVADLEFFARWLDPRA